MKKDDSTLKVCEVCNRYTWNALILHQGLKHCKRCFREYVVKNNMPPMFNKNTLQTATDLMEGMG